jgi:hypothetical protein
MGTKRLKGHNFRRYRTSGETKTSSRQNAHGGKTSRDIISVGQKVRGDKISRETKRPGDITSFWAIFLISSFGKHVLETPTLSLAPRMALEISARCGLNFLGIITIYNNRNEL